MAFALSYDFFSEMPPLLADTFAGHFLGRDYAYAYRHQDAQLGSLTLGHALPLEVLFGSA